MDKQTRLDILTRGYLGVFLLAILMSTFVSSGTMYAGESETITLPEEYDYWSVVGNSSPIDLEVIQNGLIVTIIPNKYMKDDSFSLVFFNNEKEIITQTIYSGGGGSSHSTRTKYVYRNITQPLFLDRNVTETVETETIVLNEIEVEGSLVWWQKLLLMLAVISIAAFIVSIILEIRADRK